ncbi:MAG TPA: thioredoxin domain-containing protein [Oculatellaceae cyanobacterium]
MLRKVREIPFLASNTGTMIHLFNAVIVSSSLLAASTLGACSDPSETRISQAAQRSSAQTENRLIHETSPYLLEHSHDPVNWYPWGAEAFKKAKSENKPILLSIGYSACHWCHVMQRESFQDQDTARIMNENFVSIKVDREERPDVDEIYMRAVQTMTGSGGWPATIFLTPNLKPFYAGTYFPNKDMFGLPSFQKVLLAVKESWHQDPKKQDSIGDEVAHSIAAMDSATTAATTVKDDTITVALQSLLKNVDTTYGGVGNSVKFPLSGPVSLCMRTVASGSARDERQPCMSFVTTTLDKMAYGGVHDHIGGGFCRYSTDRQWRVPHFEKMLCDNALISQNYLDGYQITNSPYWAQTARDTLDFCLAELASAGGAFFSSLDADSQGEEGAFYTYTREQLVDALGEQDANWFSQSFGATSDGNFHEHRNVLYLTDSPDALARRDGVSVAQYWEKVAALKNKLLAQRNRRLRPLRDEKVIAGWNALMVSSLVKGYKILGDEKYLNAARKTARFLLSKMYFDNRLHRTWAADRAGGEAYLDDYAFTVQALLDLAAVDFDSTWLKSAKELNGVILEHYSDRSTGDFFYTADYQKQPISRTRNSYDNALPSGAGIEMLNLIRLAQITGDDRYSARAERLLGLYTEAMKTSPIAYASMLNALDYFLHSSTQIVLVAPAEVSRTKEISAVLFGTYAPNTCTLFFKNVDHSDTRDELLRGKKSLADQPTVYLCQHMVCEKPITNPDILKQKLKQLSVEHKL